MPHGFLDKPVAASSVLHVPGKQRNCNHILYDTRSIFTISKTLHKRGGTINGSPTSQGTGDIDFGPNACVELYETQLRWSDYYLKGINTGILEELP